MPRLHGTTDAQSSFLRAFRKYPSGPPPELWPSHTVLARWLRHPGFVHAWESLRQTLQVESQLRVDAAGILLTTLESQLANPAASIDRAQLDRAADVLRTAYLRDRFGTPHPLR